MMENPHEKKWRVGNRYCLYRFHIHDPIRFDTNFKATIQALGWRQEHRYLPLQDDMASVAYWYQLEPHIPFGKSYTRDELEIPLGANRDDFEFDFDPYEELDK